MISNIASYHRPDDIQVALTLLREGRGRMVPLAGGTSLLGNLPREVEAVVDLRDLRLDWLLVREAGLALGAMVTLREVVEHEGSRRYAGGVLAEAARHEAGSLVRNQATLGGTLAGRAATSDLAAVLLAVDAQVVVQGTSEQVVSLGDLFRRRDYLLQPGALLTEVRLPALEEGTQVRLERVARTPMDQPILAVAAKVQREGNHLKQVRVAVSGISDMPHLLATLNHHLPGLEVGSEPFEAALRVVAEGLTIKSDQLASASYRAAMLPVLVRRALTG